MIYLCIVLTLVLLDHFFSTYQIIEELQKIREAVEATERNTDR
jgi:hypothetical protein